jgi:hypothetical protein
MVMCEESGLRCSGADDCLPAPKAHGDGLPGKLRVAKDLFPFPSPALFVNQYMTFPSLSTTRGSNDSCPITSASIPPKVARLARRYADVIGHELLLPLVPPLSVSIVHLPASILDDPRVLSSLRYMGKLVRGTSSYPIATMHARTCWELREVVLQLNCSPPTPANRHTVNPAYDEELQG